MGVPSFFFIRKLFFTVSTGPISSSGSIAPPPDLRAFKEAARRQTDGFIELDGQQLRVLGTGTTPSQRPVAWVRGNGSAAGDTNSAFVGALGQSFSSGIASAVARELGLAPAPGVPLAARTVERAIDMAKTGQQVMDGVHFMTRLNLSATHRGAGFARACQVAGLDPASLNAAQRAAIDAALDQRFLAATQQGGSPVDPQTAAGWLRQILAELPGG